MLTRERELTEDEVPTAREVPSGKWLIAVDRAAHLIAIAIERLEPHDKIPDVAAALADLRAAASLTRGNAA